jgi:mono/diheme cytochrome c family protein
LKGKTLTDIAADMWNHAPKMAQPPPQLGLGELRQIVSQLWSQTILQDSGSAADGKKVFAAKNCGACHPASRGGTFSPIAMISILWRHGPRMLQEMEAKKLPWPKLTGRQMSDLIAYLNAGGKQ